MKTEIENLAVSSGPEGFLCLYLGGYQKLLSVDYMNKLVTPQL